MASSNDGINMASSNNGIMAPSNTNGAPGHNTSAGAVYNCNVAPVYNSNAPPGNNANIATPTSTVTDHTPTPVAALPPRLFSLKKLKSEGVNWREWLLKPSSVYIASQERKYTGNPMARDMWLPRQLSWRQFIGEITVEEFLWEYEKFCRHYLWNDLDNLEGKDLACWCLDLDFCHGRVLQRLFHEKKSATPMTRNVSTQTEDMWQMDI